MVGREVVVSRCSIHAWRRRRNGVGQGARDVLLLGFGGDDISFFASGLGRRVADNKNSPLSRAGLLCVD